MALTSVQIPSQRSVTKSLLKVATLEESLATCSDSFSKTAIRSKNPLSRSLTRVKNIGSSVLQRLSCSHNQSDSLANASHRTWSTHMDEDTRLECIDDSVKTVSFATVSIRSYEIAASDNPSVSCGPAIELGWKYATHLSTSVEKFESMRCRPTLGRHKEFKLTMDERLKILLKTGHSIKEIQEMTLRCNKARNLRQKTFRKVLRAQKDGRLKQLDDQKTLKQRFLGLINVRRIKKIWRKPRKMETANAY